MNTDKATLRARLREVQNKCNGRETAKKRQSISADLEWFLDASCEMEMPSDHCRIAKATLDMGTTLDEMRLELRNAFVEIEGWALEVGAAERSVSYDGEFSIGAGDMKSIVERNAARARAENGYISVVELAELLVISEHSVRRRCDEGKFPMPYLLPGRKNGEVINIDGLPPEEREKVRSKRNKAP